MSTPAWTTTPPSEPGWWWYRRQFPEQYKEINDAFAVQRIVWLYRDNCGLLRVSEDHDLPGSVNAKAKHEWCGPIAPPPE